MPQGAGWVPEALLEGGYSMLGLAGQTGRGGGRGRTCTQQQGNTRLALSRGVGNWVTRPAHHSILIVTGHHQSTGVER